MSIICITEHNESIYNTTKAPVSYANQQAKFAAKKYRRSSQQSERLPATSVDTNAPAAAADAGGGDDAPAEATTADRKKAKAVMGTTDADLPDPNNYLRKGQRKRPRKKVEKRRRPQSRLPDIPHRDDVLKEQDEKLKHKHKDFITKNSLKVRNMQPPPPKHPPSLPIKSNKDTGFGKVPDYLNEMMKEAEQKIQTAKDVVGLIQPKCQYITRDQREKLLYGLKYNWEELQIQYQGLPILTDTIPKILRKSNLEGELKQIEKDIVLVERHPYIYVYKDEKALNSTK